MKLKEIIDIIDGNIVCGQSRLQDEVISGFASDLMSDVLTTSSDNLLLITGLTNPQVIRTAEMSDISYVVLVRGKRISTEMIKLADENNIALIETDYSMFRTSGELMNAGLKPLF
ncbi:MAG: DRTGG domain-containing protein [Bacteroidota bacterium]|nr:DRTGG domain-containing protein [Bacteroidota bacterium]